MINKITKPLTWYDINVQQFIAVSKLSNDITKEDTEKVEEVVGILYNLSPRQVGDLELREYRRLSEEAGVLLNSQVPGKPPRTIKVNGRRYSIEYNPVKLMHWQVMFLSRLADDYVVLNMHLFLASIVRPITWYGRKLPSTRQNHHKIAEDLLQASVVTVYHASLYYCTLYRELLISRNNLKGNADIDQ